MKDDTGYGSFSQHGSPPKEIQEGGGIKIWPFIPRTGYLRLLIALTWLAFEWHWIAIVCATLSACTCWWAGYAEYSIVDPMIFKSIYVVFGFALGFRNVRANFRYGEALNHTKTLFGNAWCLVTLFRDTEQRRKVSSAVVCLLEAIANHVEAISYRADSWYGVIGLRPKIPHPEAHNELWFAPEAPDKIDVLVAPRALMVSVFVMAGNEICKTEQAPYQERKRTVWMLREHFFIAYEQIEVLALPSVTKAFWFLISNVLCLFGIALPWGISVSGHEQGLHDAAEVHHRAVGEVFTGHGFKSLFFIVFNTLTCMVMLFVLNALAHETEQPFRGGAGEALQLKDLVRRFADAMKDYEGCRDVAGKDAEGQFSKGDALSTDPESEAAFLDNEIQKRICA
jgi:hypothetical protein